MMQASETAKPASKEESMGIRFMPSIALEDELQVAERGESVARQTQSIRSLESSASKVSTMQWREGVERRPVRRCLLSAKFAVQVCVGVLVAASISAVWVPSALVADAELIAASEEQLTSGAEQVSKELLGHFQIASSNAKIVSLMYGMSFPDAPAEAPEAWLNEYGAGSWSLLKQAPMLSHVLIAQAREQSLVNAEDPACDVDVALMSATYMANFNHKTTGTGLTVTDMDAFVGNASDVAPAGKARVNYVLGDSDLSNPTGFKSTFAFVDCNTSVGGGEFLWRSNGLSSDWSQKDADITETVWLSGTTVLR